MSGRGETPGSSAENQHGEPLEYSPRRAVQPKSEYSPEPEAQPGPASSIGPGDPTNPGSNTDPDAQQESNTVDPGPSTSTALQQQTAFATAEAMRDTAKGTSEHSTLAVFLRLMDKLIPSPGTTANPGTVANSGTVVGQTTVAKLPEPHRYRATNLDAHYRWCCYMDQYFIYNAHTFQTEKSKVNYAAALLGDEHGIAWSHRPPASATTSWQGFQQWLLDRIEDPRYRPWTAAVRFYRLRQQPGQTARSFLNEFELRRGELDPDTIYQPDHPSWTRIFFSMLREELGKLQSSSRILKAQSNPGRRVLFGGRNAVVATPLLLCPQRRELLLGQLRNCEGGQRRRRFLVRRPQEFRPPSRPGDVAAVETPAPESEPAAVETPVTTITVADADTVVGDRPAASEEDPVADPSCPEGSTEDFPRGLITQKE
ncbi:hypothetical protein DTO280E4_8 [Paecilomyces variotii]|nr:hypothetical protein DTO280E4_8 [Paecilomyces variotii]